MIFLAWKVFEIEISNFRYEYFRLIGNFTCKKNVRKFLNGNFQNVEHAKGDDEKGCKINV